MWPALSSAKKRNGGPARVAEQAVRRTRPSSNGDHRVVLAVDDRQRHGPLRGLELRVGVGRGLALEDHPGRDRERAGDRLGAVHQQAVGEEAALRVAADEVVLDRVDPLQLVQRLGHQRGALAVGAGEAAEGAPADVVDVSVIERRASSAEVREGSSPLMPRRM